VFKKEKQLIILLIVLSCLLLFSSLSVWAGDKIVVGVGGWAVDPTKEALKELKFTEKTGVEVEVVTRPGSPPDFISQMSSSILGGSSPYDVVDMEDDVAINFSRAGWLVDLNPLYDESFWQDWPDAMLEMVEVWHKYEGTLFRIPHNYEAQYFFYRKDLFDEKGLEVPETWDEMVEIGRELKTEQMWGVSDGLAKGGYLEVFLGYLTKQAGGNMYEVDIDPDPFRTALQFVHDMMYKHEIMPTTALNKDFDAVNSDYTHNRVAMMRMWPYFYNVVRSNSDWFEEDKAVIALPPAGPESMVTYAACWGWAIPKTASNVEAAKTFVKFMTSVENAPKLAEIDTWFLSARYSVMDTVGNKGMARYLKMYSDAGVIGTRPFHPQMREAANVLEEVASAYLTKQISLNEAMERAQSRIRTLKE
jgi:multiple sugar transport system substrate-binding protein